MDVRKFPINSPPSNTELAKTVNAIIDGYSPIMHTTVWTSEPPNKQEGTLVAADGTSWNPGAGKGFYIYLDGVWKPVYPQIDPNSHAHSNKALLDVIAGGSDTVVTLDGTGSAGAATTYSRGDHKHAFTVDTHTHTNLTLLNLISSGEYAMGLAPGLNMSDISLAAARYIRVGWYATVSATVSVTTTGAGATFWASLPVTFNNFSNASDAAGSASSGIFGGQVAANPASTNVYVTLYNGGAGTFSVKLHFTYSIV